MSRSRLSASERRQHILGAAFPLFAARGFDAITTREIAESAGVSEALLYRHFESKQALFDAIKSHCIEEVTQDVAALEQLPDDTATLVACVYILSYNIQRGSSNEAERRMMSRMLMRSLLGGGNFTRAFLEETSAPWVRKLRSCVRAAIDSGDLKATEKEAEACLWLCHHVSAALKFYGMPDEQVVPYPVEDDELLEMSVRFSLRGIGLTEEAIERYFNPRAFQLMLSSR